MSNIAVYIRVSTQKQVEEGVSLEMQKQLIDTYINSVELDQLYDKVVYYVDEGASAASLSRPKMLELISAVKEGSIGTVVAYDLSRISRDISDSNLFLQMLKKYDVNIKCLNDEVELHSAGNRFSTNVKNCSESI